MHGKKVFKSFFHLAPESTACGPKSIYYFPALYLSHMATATRYGGFH